MPVDDIAINSGLSRKIIHNGYKSSGKQVVLDASTNHTLYNSIWALIEIIYYLHKIKLNGMTWGLAELFL